MIWVELSAKFLLSAFGILYGLSNVARPVSLLPYFSGTGVRPGKHTAAAGSGFPPGCCVTT